MRSEDSNPWFPAASAANGSFFRDRQATAKWSNRLLAPGRPGWSFGPAQERFCWAGTREGARRSHRGPAQRRSETDGSSRSSDLSRKQRRQGKWGGWCSLVAVPITRALPPPRSPSEPPGTSPKPPARNHTPHANDAEHARRAASSAHSKIIYGGGAGVRSRREASSPRLGCL